VGHATSVFNEYSAIPHKLLAVSFFFMLSGFVIGITYGDRLTRSMTARAFYFARIIRLYPLIALGSLEGWVCAARLDTYGLHCLAFSTLVIPMPDVTFPLNPPEWSLFFELLGCAFFPLLISMPTMVLALVSLSCLVVSGILSHIFGATVPFSFHVFDFTASFGIGIVLWKFRPQLPDWKAPFLLLGVIIVAACALPVPFGLYDAAVMLLVFPTIVVMGASHSDNVLLKWLGALSYPLYIVHYPILLFTRNHIAGNAGIFISIIASYCAAWIALRFFDIPVRRLLTRWLKRQSAAPVAEA
jgi:peptidoglycan/LPS O-acetylase OafA/YrhL